MPQQTAAEQKWPEGGGGYNFSQPDAVNFVYKPGITFTYQHHLQSLASTHSSHPVLTAMASADIAVASTSLKSSLLKCQTLGVCELFTNDY